ncbi:MAG: acetyl-CoA carboxylase carboxyltransferase subunit alpha [Planctomycetes bacterium]|nr:acetyl-CoA carboxylase carboxyltransferase subunit alpha [Planctomycetota bacterium]
MREHRFHAAMPRKDRKSISGPTALPFKKPIEDVRSRLEELEELAGQTTHDLSEELAFYRDRLERLTQEIYGELTPWNRVQVARHPNRPLTSDFVEHLCADFVELHGDGYYGDDRAILTGLATIYGEKVLLVGHRKGKSTKERLACHFGSAHPEGYRKALRKMRLGERLGLPIVCLVNTPGAYPGVGAEERGQARAIAENIFEMFEIRTQIIVVVIGEGGSGGALGIAVGDHIAMMENSWYSVISPEGCASILWRSADGKEQAAEALKLTAQDMQGLGLVDEILPEPVGGAHADPRTAMNGVGEAIAARIQALRSVPLDELLEARYQKFRRIAQLEQAIQAEAEKAANTGPREVLGDSDESPDLIPEGRKGVPPRRTPGSPRGRRL